MSKNESAVVEAMRAVKDQLKARLKERSSKNGTPHLVVNAGAGTGKTFTLVEGIRQRFGQPEFEGTPSPQQVSIWGEIKRGELPKRVLFCAFGKSIAKKLQEEIPAGCDASTVHSQGYKAVRKRVGHFQVQDWWKTVNLVEEVTGEDKNEIRKRVPDLLRVVHSLVRMVKLTLAGCTFTENLTTCILDPETLDKDCLDDLCGKYDITVDGNEKEVYELVRKVIEISADPESWPKQEIDYADMIWLPVVLNLTVTPYDLILVDEAQDLNACQQRFLLKMVQEPEGRVVACGDTRQAIFGFAGADTESIPNLSALLRQTGREVVVNPLSVTFRCGKAIVREACKIVKDYEAWKDNEEGEVIRMTHDAMMESAEEGDMVLCRVNAPLVGTAFRFITQGKKATIVGGDIGKGLITLINKFKASSVSELMDKVEEWCDGECQKICKRKNPSEAQIISINDKRDSVLAFCEGCLEVSDVLNSIKGMFEDNVSEGIRMSSIHRAKGLEANRVFITEPQLLPHPMAKTKWQQEQEMNLKYVAITRAIKSLVWVQNV